MTEQTFPNLSVCPTCRCRARVHAIVRVSPFSHVSYCRARELVKGPRSHFSDVGIPRLPWSTAYSLGHMFPAGYSHVVSGTCVTGVQGTHTHTHTRISPPFSHSEGSTVLLLTNTDMNIITAHRTRVLYVYTPASIHSTVFSFML